MARNTAAAPRGPAAPHGPLHAQAAHSLAHAARAASPCRAAPPRFLWQEKLASCTKATPPFLVDHRAICPISKAYAIKVVVKDLVHNLVGKIENVHSYIVHMACHFEFAHFQNVGTQF